MERGKGMKCQLTDEGLEVCWLFNEGSCRFGDPCKFAHRCSKGVLCLRGKDGKRIRK